MRLAARVDGTQKEIVKALRAVGVQVYYIKKPVDLLCALGKRNVLIEVKDEDGRLTKDQIDFMAIWPGELHVCQTPEQALRAMLGDEAFT